MFIFDGVEYGKTDGSDSNETFLGLINIIKHGNLPDYRLTFAAEALGYSAWLHRDRLEKIIDILLPLLDDKSPVVIEGAIYGLMKAPPTPRVISKLHQLELTSESHSIREVAKEALEALEEAQLELDKQLKMSYDN